MKLQLLTTTALAAAFSVIALAVVDEQQTADFQADCRKYAQEDGVATDEMEDYIAQCVEDMVAAQSEKAEDEPAGDDSKE